MLRHLGASEEQIDRQRERIRDELFGTPLTMELLLPLPGRRAEQLKAGELPEENEA